MPSWHEATAELQAADDIQMVGIIQEQHPNRARLFMQWKQMGWPILVDSINALSVTVVPITLALDEHGVVRRSRFRRVDIGAWTTEFVATEYDAPDGADDATPVLPDTAALRPDGDGEDDAAAWRTYGDALALFGGSAADGEGEPDAVATPASDVVDAYSRAVELDASDSVARFRLGVALRKRYDNAAERQADDFQRAVRAWTEALALTPNNYIWRRRIQQYGPRLDKPYPFYDWVPTARDEVEARGETPAALAAEPSGAEFATPLRAFEADASGQENPDPEGRVSRDDDGLITVETALAPAWVSAGSLARAHVTLRCNPDEDGHWNNEAEPLTLWLDVPEGWEVDAQRLVVPNADEEVSEEARTIEFELRCPADAGTGAVTLAGFALYNVCCGEDGVCQFLRQDIEIDIEVRD